MFRGSFSGGNLIQIESIDSSDSPYNLSTGSECLLVDTADGEVTVNLPSPNTCIGKVFYIKNIAGGDDNFVSIVPPSGLVDGDATLNLENVFSAVTLVSDGTDYFILA
jgi:hypothetical protein